jgi:hypothetical protein
MMVTANVRQLNTNHLPSDLGRNLAHKDTSLKWLCWISTEFSRIVRLNSVLL